MANYSGAARSNYFRVKDDSAFEEAMASLPESATSQDDEGRFMVMSTCPDTGGWVTLMEDEKTGEDIEVDLAAIISEHLADDEVAVLMEAGHEKLRYISGYAQAINARGERRTVSLADIYDLARELGPNVTEATY